MGGSKKVVLRLLVLIVISSWVIGGLFFMFFQRRIVFIFHYCFFINARLHFIILSARAALHYGGIGHSFGVVLGWYWVVLGGIGADLMPGRWRGRSALN